MIKLRCAIRRSDKGMIYVLVVSFPGDRVGHSTQCIEDDGVRNGLDGGNADNGGASNVDNNSRDNANDNLTVRLVLARNALKLFLVIPLFDKVVCCA